MPYIKQEDRDKILKTEYDEPMTPGELNYIITVLVSNYLSDHDEGYTWYNSAIGVLECAKLELYRRMISPYEDEKCEENGDVYN